MLRSGGVSEPSRAIQPCDQTFTFASNYVRSILH